MIIGLWSTTNRSPHQRHLSVTGKQYGLGPGLAVSHHSLLICGGAAKSSPTNLFSLLTADFLLIHLASFLVFGDGINYVTSMSAD